MGFRDLAEQIRTLQLKLGDLLTRLGLIEPAGVITAFAGSTAPAGWLLCDGSAVSRATHSVLFAAIGTIYGAGNGSTTFNLPDLTARVIVGRAAGDLDFGTLGKTGGAKTHTLTTAQMPAHSHTQRKSTSTLGAGGVAYGVTSPAFPGASDTSAQSTLDAGGGQAHNNLQPYLVVNYIIKTS